MGLILVSVEIGGHDQAGFGAGSADEFEHFFVAVQGFGSPVFGDLGEQPVLDGIPFGSAGRIVSDGDREAEAIAQLTLEFDLPGPGSATIAAAGVGQEQKLGRAAVAAGSFAFSPSGDGVGGEGRRVVGDADADGAAVMGRVVNAVRDTYPAGIGKEVVIVDQNGRAVQGLGAGSESVASRYAGTVDRGRGWSWWRSACG
jgi:hypothetical protein